MTRAYKRLRCLLAGLVLAAMLPPSVLWAHEVRPAYLELKETAPGRFNVLWRTPILSGMRLPVVLALPDDVRNLKEPMVQELTDSLVERRWIVSVRANPRLTSHRKVGESILRGWQRRRLV